MKTTTTILLSTLIAQLSTVLAETVYLNNVGVHDTAYASPNQLEIIREYVQLWDVNGISSVRLQPFLTLQDDQGNALPQSGFVFLINYLDGDGYHQLLVADATQLLTIPTHTLISQFDQPQDPPQPVYLDAGFQLEDGPNVNWPYQGNLTAPQTWYYGFDVLSYETAATVPEPSTFLLLAGGLVAVLLHRFYNEPMNPSPGFLVS